MIDSAAGDFAAGIVYIDAIFQKIALSLLCCSMPRKKPGEVLLHNVNPIKIKVALKLSLMDRAGIGHDHAK